MSVSTPSLPSPTPRALEECEPGALLGGKYRVDRLIGEGGMSTVWLARNEFLDLPVAIKLVRREIRGSEAEARLLTEARVLANLRHPNVARVYDYGTTASGDSYIVMERLEGHSLAECIARDGSLSPVFAVQMLLPVIDALCAAHRAGVVHRDLKPDNIFITVSSGVPCPKLLDFGIAKLEDETSPRLTGRGGVLGSPAYMAPEQARGLSDVDQRVDVWAACVVLYECVTGGPAFDAENYNALMLKVIEDEPQPLDAAGAEGLWPIIAAGLAKDRDQRTPTMLALGAQLESWLTARGAVADLGGEPLGWRWAFSKPEEPLDLPPRTVSVLRGGIDTLAVPKSIVRKPAPMRLLMAACVGGPLLVLGMNFGPVWSSSPPVPAVAKAEAEPPRPQSPDAVRPLPLDRVEHTADATPPERLGNAQSPTALAVPSQSARSETPVDRSVRAAPKAIYSTATFAAERALQAYPPPSATSLPRASAARVKSVRRPSEAELGLKNPW